MVLLAAHSHDLCAISDDVSGVDNSSDTVDCWKGGFFLGCSYQHQIDPDPARKWTALYQIYPL